MQKNSYTIDSRTREELCRDIERLAASYTPEWDFRAENPDVGSTIGLIFAGQMADNIGKLNRTLEKYRTEFVNMLNIALLPAYPAHGVAVLEPIRDTVPGVDVPRGTKLLGAADGEDDVIFETVRDTHVTNARIRDVLAISRKFGKIIPLAGAAQTVRSSLFPEPEEAGEEEGNVEEGIGPFPLFDYTLPGIEQNQLLICHRSMFDTARDVRISVRLLDSAGANVSEALAEEGRYRWMYYTDDGFVPFEGIYVEDGAVQLRKQDENAKVGADGDEVSVICIESLQPVQETVELSGIELSSFCPETPPECVVHEARELEPGRFLPFGETASLFDECYIGCDDVFAQPGAQVELRFDLAYREKYLDLTAAQEEKSLKIIKRKPRTVQFEVVETCAERISVEYFNGTGWRSLGFGRDMTRLFAGENTGPVALSFPCPEDWEPVVAGGYSGRSIRMRVVQADNCYLRPCVHKMPVIENLTLSYDYRGNWRLPHRVFTVRGTTERDETERVVSRRSFPAFAPISQEGNAVYFGFDRKIQGSPVSLFFDIEEASHIETAPVRFEYSTVRGFVPLKIIDGTEQLSHAGIVAAMPRPDFAKVEIEGCSRYWIRAFDDSGAFDTPGRRHPLVRSVWLNALEVRNLQTLPEEVFYIDVATPNMEFAIAAQNILSAKVFVNERGRLAPAAMRQIIEQQPDDVRAEYNHIGEISEFFVRWTEVENFDESAPTDRHYQIDRMNNTIRFGDGVSVMIPQAQNGPAFTVQAVCCDGDRGNLPAGAIQSSYGQLHYIDRIDNPVSTYAGNNIESIEKALERGANLVNGKNRLVSEQDFVREVEAFSAQVDQVRCVIGRDIYGHVDDRLVSLVVLMKDYAKGGHSFRNLESRIRQRILERCETAISDAVLSVTEPIRVAISVDVWAQTASAEAFFGIQGEILRAIDSFLDPVGAGWPLGVLPSASQIRMMLGAVQCDARIRHCAVTARYTDRTGTHERDLGEIAATPFMIGVNGTHHVHMTLAD